MDAPSPEHRVRSGFMSLGLWTSAFAFFVMEGYVWHDQWEIGHASAMFMLGTAFLIAGFCMGLFAIIVAIGLAISAMYSASAAHRASWPRTTGLAPIADAGGHASRFPDSENWGKAAGPQ